jgi:hypothetical protein
MRAVSMMIFWREEAMSVWIGLETLMTEFFTYELDKARTDLAAFLSKTS